MPAWMSELFEMLRGEAAPAGPRVRLETDPRRVEATQAYREGKLSQLDFFAALGVGKG